MRRIKFFAGCAAVLVLMPITGACVYLAAAVRFIQALHAEDIAERDRLTDELIGAQCARAAGQACDVDVQVAEVALRLYEHARS